MIYGLQNAAKDKSKSYVSIHVGGLLLLIINDVEK